MASATLLWLASGLSPSNDSSFGESTTNFSRWLPLTSQPQRLWDYVRDDLAGGDAWTIYCILPNVSHLLVFWTIASLFSVFDFVPPAWNPLSRYKVQPGKNEPPAWDRVLRAVLVTFGNQALVNTGVSYAVFRIASHLSLINASASLPPPSQLIFELVIWLIVEEFCFCEFIYRRVGVCRALLYSQIRTLVPDYRCRHMLTSPPF